MNENISLGGRKMAGFGFGKAVGVGFHIHINLGKAFSDVGNLIGQAAKAASQVGPMLASVAKELPQLAQAAGQLAPMAAMLAGVEDYPDFSPLPHMQIRANLDALHLPAGQALDVLAQQIASEYGGNVPPEVRMQFDNLQRAHGRLRQISDQGHVIHDILQNIAYLGQQDPMGQYPMVQQQLRALHASIEPAKAQIHAHKTALDKHIGKPTVDVSTSAQLALVDPCVQENADLVCAFQKSIGHEPDGKYGTDTAHVLAALVPSAPTGCHPRPAWWAAHGQSNCRSAVATATNAIEFPVTPSTPLTEVQQRNLYSQTQGIDQFDPMHGVGAPPEPPPIDGSLGDDRDWVHDLMRRYSSVDDKRGFAREILNAREDRREAIIRRIRSGLGHSWSLDALREYERLRREHRPAAPTGFAGAPPEPTGQSIKSMETPGYLQAPPVGAAPVASHPNIQAAAPTAAPPVAHTAASAAATTHEAAHAAATSSGVDTSHPVVHQQALVGAQAAVAAQPAANHPAVQAATSAAAAAAAGTHPAVTVMHQAAPFTAPVVAHQNIPAATHAAALVAVRRAAPVARSVAHERLNRARVEHDRRRQEHAIKLQERDRRRQERDSRRQDHERRMLEMSAAVAAAQASGDQERWRREYDRYQAEISQYAQIEQGLMAAVQDAEAAAAAAQQAVDAAQQAVDAAQQATDAQSSDDDGGDQQPAASTASNYYLYRLDATSGWTPVAPSWLSPADVQKWMAQTDPNATYGAYDQSMTWTPMTPS
jgi:hypothetical protein